MIDYKALIQEEMEDGATEAEAREVVIARKILEESESDTVYDSEELPPAVAKSHGN